jgi:threonine synthase
MAQITHLECSLCGQSYQAGKIHNLCSCGGTLYVRYDLGAVRANWDRDQLSRARRDMWRYAPVLPYSGRFPRTP